MKAIKVTTVEKVFVEIQGSLQVEGTVHTVHSIFRSRNPSRKIFCSNVNWYFQKIIVEERFPSSDVAVGHAFSHIALSCDDLTLAVCFERGDTCMLGFIDVRAFVSNVSNQISLPPLVSFYVCMSFHIYI